jgi:hypothetical protein
MPRIDWLSYALLSFVFGALACASSSQSKAPEHAASTAAQRPLPSDPLELAVLDPSAVVSLRVDLLRSSPLYARALPYIERETCMSSAELDALIKPISRAILASRSEKNHKQWLIVLSGSFTDADAERALTAAVRGKPQTASSAEQIETIGRFQLRARSGLAASVLESRIVVLGQLDWVRASLKSIEQPIASFVTSSLWRELGGQVGCADRAVCTFAAANGVAAQDLQSSMSGLGAKALGQQLSAADTVLGLSVPDGVELGLVTRLPSPDLSEGVIKATKDWLWQAGLLIRLAGLPDVLDAVELRSSANLVQAQLRVSAEDLAQYEERVASLLEGAQSACPNASAATSP